MSTLPSLARPTLRVLMRNCRPMSGGYKPAPPSPPELPPALQKEWTKLQKEAETKGQQVYFHPDVRRKPRPEFEGERNPVTGELNGPKNDPLRHGDYSYNGRCTDF